MYVQKDVIDLNLVLFQLPVIRELIHRRAKRWPLSILPQYLANLTQPTGTHRKPYSGEINPCTNKIVYARFEIFRLFLCVFMSDFRIFVH